MKRLLFILAIIGLIFVYTGCSKKNNGTIVTTPTLTTTAISNITDSSAVSGGNITSDGGAIITARGVCWSTSSNPTIVLTTKTTDGTGTSSYTSSITGLLPTTTYFVKAYATNSIGTAYGNELSFTSSQLTIGASYGGGIIAYILQPGDPGYSSTVQHGLIAATSDQNNDTGREWGNGTNITTGASGTAIGTGSANTTTIIARQGAGNYAAYICHSYSGGGYTDWYLPSISELNMLYINQTIIGGFIGGIYWSSSEGGGSYAMIENFNNGFQINYPKSDGLGVHAVRSF